MKDVRQTLSPPDLQMRIYRSSLEFTEISRALEILEEYYDPDSELPLPHTAVRMLSLCRRAVESEPELSDFDWEKFYTLRGYLADISDQEMNDLVHDYSKQAAFWLRLLDESISAYEAREFYRSHPSSAPPSDGAEHLR